MANQIKKSELLSGFYLFGNKGAVWNNASHITQSGNSLTMCGTPMLSSNYADEHDEIGICEECKALYEGTKKLIFDVLEIRVQNHLLKIVTDLDYEGSEMYVKEDLSIAKILSESFNYGWEYDDEADEYFNKASQEEIYSYMLNVIIPKLKSGYKNR